MGSIDARFGARSGVVDVAAREVLDCTVSTWKRRIDLLRPLARSPLGGLAPTLWAQSCACFSFLVAALGITVSVVVAFSHWCDRASVIPDRVDRVARQMRLSSARMVSSCLAVKVKRDTTCRLDDLASVLVRFLSGAPACAKQSLGASGAKRRAQGGCWLRDLPGSLAARRCNCAGIGRRSCMI